MHRNELERHQRLDARAHHSGCHDAQAMLAGVAFARFLLSMDVHARFELTPATQRKTF
jgi:hypothetical protein